MDRDQQRDAGTSPTGESGASPTSAGKRSLTERLVQRSTAAALGAPRAASTSTARGSTLLAATVDPFDWAALSAPDVQLAGPGADDATVHAAAAQGVATPASSLPYLDTLTAAFGPEHDLGGVRAHVGGAAEASAHAMGAQAYATGRDVVLPASPSLHLVAHEATHVVQQRAGVHLAGGVGAAGDAYEQEADRIADAVVRGERVGERLEIGGGASSAVQRQQADDARGSGTTATGGSNAMWQHVVGERSTAVGKLARVRAPRGVRLRTQPAAGAPDGGVMPFDELVHVERRTEHGWCWVVSMGTMAGHSGFCEEQFLSLDPPEPTAHLHQVQPGDRLADIAVRYYGANMSDANNARLYVQALYLANQGHAGVYLEEVDLGLGDTIFRRGAEEETLAIYKGAKVRAGLAIWVPSQAFIDQLRASGAVTSGSTEVTKAWRAAKEIVNDAIDAVKYGAGFVVGLLEGSWNAIVDLFAGAADMIEAVAKVVYHLVTGNPLAIKDMLMGWVDKLKVAWASRDKIADEFMKKWEAKDAWDRGTFQGEVLGWVMMTALIAILTAGEGAAAMMTGKWASVLKVLKTVDALGDVTTYARKVGKLPGKAVELIQGKLGKGAAKAEKAGLHAAEDAGDVAGDAADAAGDTARRAGDGATVGDRARGSPPEPSDGAATLEREAVRQAFRRARKVRKIDAVSLKRLRIVLGQAGAKPGQYALVRATRKELDALGDEASNVFGWVVRDGAGTVRRDLRGRPVITFTPKGLSSLEQAVKTYGHEVQHLKDFAAGLSTSSEALAEEAGENLWMVVEAMRK